MAPIRFAVPELKLLAWIIFTDVYTCSVHDEVLKKYDLKLQSVKNIILKMRRIKITAVLIADPYI
jgi:hypothetical protein